MDPEVQGLSGAEALNQSFDYGAEAGKELLAGQPRRCSASRPATCAA